MIATVRWMTLSRAPVTDALLIPHEIDATTTA